jgi:hypothetical protein
MTAITPNGVLWLMRTSFPDSKKNDSSRVHESRAPVERKDRDLSVKDTKDTGDTKDGKDEKSPCP